MGSLAILFFVAVCWLGNTEAQRVEYMTSPSITATPMVQPCQFVIPAVIKPLLSEPEAPPAPKYPSLMPPIIIKEDNTLHHLLYFLIFAMKNRSPPMPYQYDRCCCDDSPYMPYPMMHPGMDTMYDDAPGQRDNEVTLVIRTDN